MSSRPIANASLQVIFAGIRYFLMGLVYARLDLETVGQINVMLTFVTAVTFLAGFELHQVANRHLILGHKLDLHWGFDRVVASFITIGITSALGG